MTGGLTGVRWIGGGSGAGKSTITRTLAARHGLRIYDTDAAMAPHTARTTPQQAPRLHAFVAQTPDERWLDRDPAELLESFHWFRGEAFDEIAVDLAADTAAPRGGIIAEGFRLLPDLVAPLLTDPADAVWLLPTPRMRAAVFASRGGPAWSVPARTSDPDATLRALTERDRLFTERLAEQTARLGLPAITVDLDDDLDEVAAHLARQFRLR